MDEYLVDIKDINKSFGAVHALRDVNFRIRPGEAKCLVGENGCGKSTLIKIISGVYAPDSGDIKINGNSYKSLTPKQSIAEGIQVIYQDFSLFGNLSVAENIAMSYLVHNKINIVNKKRNREIAARQLASLDISLDLDEEVMRLSVGERQIVAICRALALDAKLVIMDEPTTALTTKEIEHLYRIIDDLKSKGIALIFVSHKLDEVFAVAESVCILRDGQNVVDGAKSEFDREKVSYYMTGRKLKETSFTPKNIEEKPILQVKNLSNKEYFKDVNFQLHRGEILGITGLLGSGRTELAETIFGLRRATGGEIIMDGKRLEIKESYDALKNGIGYVPEDRLTQGLFLDLAIDRNIASSIIRKFSQRAFNIVDKEGVKQEVNSQIENLRIKTDDVSNPASSLSGGNQQRIVLAKWLATDPSILMLNCPTVGVDVGSKSNIHETIMELAHSGIGVILISDDLPEILQVSNRILVINKGEIIGEYKSSETCESELQSKLAKS